MRATRLALGILVFVGLSLAVAYPGLDSDQTLVYGRSAACFYPQSHFFATEIAHGRWPVWNPDQSAGAAPIAHPRLGLYYPLRAVFWLLPFDWAYKVYVLAHLPLAMLGAWALGKRTGFRWEVCVWMGVAYGLCAPVLMQTSNVPCLISAAWLPLMLCAADRCAETGWLRDRLHLGLVWSLMLLGGDVQTTVVAVYVTGAFLAFAVVGRWRQVTWRQGLSRYAGSLAVAALVLVSLCAIQILPAWEQARLGGDVGQSGPRLDAVRLCELALPNLFGRSIPEHTHWLPPRVGHGDFWSLSLYVGLLTCLLAVSALRHLREWRVVFAALLAVVALGPATGVLSYIWHHVAVVLPGLDTIAVSEACVIFAVVAIVWLAGRGMQQLAHSLEHRPPRSSLWAIPPAGVAALLVAVAAGVAVGALLQWREQALLVLFGQPVVLDHLVFGRGQPDHVFVQVVQTLAQAALVALALVAVAMTAGPGRRWAAAGLCVLVVVTAADSWWANRWLVIWGDRTALTQPGPVLKAIADHRQTLDRAGPFRVYRAPDWTPDGMPSRAAARPIERGVRWLANTLRPDLNLLAGTAVVDGHARHQTRDYQEAVRVERRTTPTRDDWFYAHRRPALDLLGATYFVLPARSDHRDAARSSVGLRNNTDPLLENRADDYRVLVNRHACPRTWIVPLSRLTTDACPLWSMPTSPTHSAPARPSGRSVDVDEEVWLRDVPERWLGHGSSRARLGRPGASIRYPSPSVVRVETDPIEADAYLVVADPFYPGWRAYAGDGQPRPVLRAYGLVRAVPLLPGDRTITMRYEPAWFRWGAVLSAIGLMDLVLLWLLSGWTRRGRSGQVELAS